MTSERTYPHRTHVVGRFFIGWCRQAAGAPVIDSAHTWSIDGWDAASWVIRLRRTPGRALMVGTKGRAFIAPPRRLVRVPVLGLLFRGRF